MILQYLNLDILTSDVIPIRLIQFFDPSISECEFPHPVYASSDAGGEAESGVGRRSVKSVGGEIVASQLLAVVVRRHVVDVNLVTLLLMMEENVPIS